MRLNAMALVVILTGALTACEDDGSPSSPRFYPDMGDLYYGKNSVSVDYAEFYIFTMNPTLTTNRFMNMTSMSFTRLFTLTAHLTLHSQIGTTTARLQAFPIPATWVSGSGHLTQAQSPP